VEILKGVVFMKIRINLFIFSITTFFVILWPVYIAWKPGSLPAISLDRIMLFILFLTILLNRKIYLIKQYKNIIYLIFLFFLSNLISAFMSQNVGGSVAKAVFLFFNGPMIFLFILFFIKNEEDIYTILKVIVFTMFIVNIFGLIEAIVQKLLFKNFLITVNEYVLSALTEKIREGMYRIRSVFTNPLVYCQFLLASIPIILFLLKNSKKLFMKIFLVINLILSIYLIYRTGSRAGLALIFLIPILKLIIKYYRYKLFKKIFWIFFIFFMLIAFYKIRSFVIDNWYIINNLKYFVIHGKISQEDVSTYARVLQFMYGLNYIKYKFLFGIGPGEALKAVYPLHSIDNHYLTLILSIGVIGLFLFLYIIYLSIKIAIKNIQLYNDELTLYLLTSVIIILLYYLILSIPKANILLFMFLGLIYSRNYILKMKYNKVANVSKS